MALYCEYYKFKNLIDSTIKIRSMERGIQAVIGVPVLLVYPGASARR